ncbi:MAG: prepilin-type N-terminal cleavage/methylation domain-containing protein [Oligoflexia bacterium]|nr:prepilin-type N-terminal cleavage/methylation domain-containing protein [Oligoflexia bacterium]
MMIHQRRGFSLIEVVIALAVLGILAALAIPNYNTYLDRSRQSEAKANLSMIYSTMKSFFAEYVQYTSRFDAVGVKFEGTLDYRFGFVGDFAPPADANPQGTATCINTVDEAADLFGNTPICADTYFPPTGAGGRVVLWQNNAGAINAAPFPARATVNADCFIATAYRLRNDGTFDQININESKTLTSGTSPNTCP